MPRLLIEPRLYSLIRAQKHELLYFFLARRCIFSISLCVSLVSWIPSPFHLTHEQRPATTATRKQGTRSATRRRDPPWQHLSRDGHRAPLEEPLSRSPSLQKATVTATKVVRLRRHWTWSNLRTQIVSPNCRSSSQRRLSSRRSSQRRRWFRVTTEAKRDTFWPHPNMPRFQTRGKMRKITGAKSPYCTGVFL